MKRAFSLLELLIVVAIIALLAVFLWPSFTQSNHGFSKRSACQSNLKQIGLGFLQYAQDYGERLPPARVTPTVGWVDAIFPYVKSRQLFECSAAGNQNTGSGFSTDYFYNRRLARVPQDKLSIVALTIMGGAGDENAPTWNSWMQLPADATSNSSSPSQRHQGTGNYLFADGHVKALKPETVLSTFDSPNDKPTFAVR